MNRLGSFETTVYEEAITTRAYKIPGSKLFLSALVFYTDEPLTGGIKDSMSLRLAVSANRKADPLKSQALAEAEFAYDKAFDAGRVSLSTVISGRSRAFVMRCKKP